jgi:hypothetical protein
MDTMAAPQLRHAGYIHKYVYNGHATVTTRWIYPHIWIQSPHHSYSTLDISTYMDTMAAPQLLHAGYIHKYGYNGRTTVTPRWIYPHIWIQWPHHSYSTLDILIYMYTIANHRHLPSNLASYPHTVTPRDSQTVTTHSPIMRCAELPQTNRQNEFK